jgi:hypothetical protein
MAVLKKIVIDEISAVRKPAQTHAKVLIIKSADAAPETGDEAVTEILKLQSNGDFDGFEKSDYLGLLNSLAEEIQADGESIEKAFTRGLETPAGIELFGLMKRAKGSEVKVEGDAPQDTVARRDEPATAELELKAQELARKTGLSYAQAFTRIIDDPKYRRLRDDANGERQLALIRSLTPQQARDLEPVVKPFPAYGKPGDDYHMPTSGRTTPSAVSGQRR